MTEMQTSAFEWAWGWFQLHAQQRMQLVSFWFVAMSFLATGAIVAYTSGYPGACALACWAIAAASILFFLLDLRTQELIGYGERVMAGLEAKVAKGQGLQDFRLASAMHDVNRIHVSYRTLFAILYLGTSVLSVTSALVILW